MVTGTTISLDRQRASLVAQQRTLLDKSDNEKRDMTAEETAQYNKIDADVDRLGEEIALAHSQTFTVEGDDGASTFGAGFDQKRLSALARSGRRREAFASYARAGEISPRSAAVGSFISNGWDGLSTSEMAALQVDFGSAGGNLVLPEQFVAQIIKAKDDLNFMRQICTVLPLTTSEAVGVPTLDSDPSDADWTGEISPVSEDTAMSFGKRVMTPHAMSKLVKISKALVRRSAIPADTLVRDRLAYKMAATEEKSFLTGHGGGQSLGVYAANEAGISTARDVSLGNTQTAITGEGLINALFSLKAGYHTSPTLRWIFHREIVREIRKLKDGNGQYIWSPGLGGTPDNILEVPFLMSEYSPSVMTAGSYVGIIGDFQFYWICESLRMELQRLDELYAATNQIGFIGLAEVDGMPVLEEAFARVTLAP